MKLKFWNKQKKNDSKNRIDEYCYGDELNPLLAYESIMEYVNDIISENSKYEDRKELLVFLRKSMLLDLQYETMTQFIYRKNSYCNSIKRNFPFEFMLYLENENNIKYEVVPFNDENAFLTYSQKLKFIDNKVDTNLFNFFNMTFGIYNNDSGNVNADYFPELNIVVVYEGRHRVTTGIINRIEGQIEARVISDRDYKFFEKINVEVKEGKIYFKLKDENIYYEVPDFRLACIFEISKLINKFT